MNISSIIKTDILVIGGGIAGLMAAIRAADKGADVLIAEKAHVLRGGSGATGNDHFLCHVPELHGDISVAIREVANSQTALCGEGRMIRYHMEHAFDIVREWHEWGINMKPSGTWHCSGHAFPGRPKIWLKYSGHNQKAVLVAEAKKRGVRFLNHHPAIELLRGGAGVSGAILLNTGNMEPELKIAQARAVIMATGCTTRLYNNEASPGWMFNQAYCPSCAGALAQGWRIGARMVNLEIPNRHAGTKYFARCGKATWAGVYRYPDGRPLGPFVTKPDIMYGDMTSDIWHSSFTDVIHNGSGPSYLDFTGLSEEGHAYMRNGLVSEGLTSQLDYMDRKGIDPRKHAIEFQQYEPHIFSRGFDIEVTGATSVPGLYAAGDTIGYFRGGIAGAAVFGSSCGVSAVEWATGHEHEQFSVDDAPVRRCVEICSSFMDRESGADWKEANLALQQIMSGYAPAAPYHVRSETLLNAGLKYLGDLRRTMLDEVRTPCSHTLMRAMETLDLMDVGEIIMHGALERKESRALHQRSDYPFTNPLLADKFLQIWREDGRIHTEWREKRA